MVINVTRGAIAISRKAIGLRVATVSDGSKGMRREMVTCYASSANSPEQRHGPADGGRQ
jgi:hypothetical protein